MPADCCLMCGRPYPAPWEPKRVCWLCKKPIRKGHKWHINADQRIVHRNCNDPESYRPEEG